MQARISLLLFFFFSCLLHISDCGLSNREHRLMRSISPVPSQTKSPMVWLNEEEPGSSHMKIFP